MVLPWLLLIGCSAPPADAPSSQSLLTRLDPTPATAPRDTARVRVARQPPGRRQLSVTAPADAWLDVALGVENGPATMQVRAGGAVLIDREVSTWTQVSVALPHAGPTELTFEVAAADPSAVALWGAPVVRSTRRSDRPNVLLYVIDGGGADLMSLYGYDRPTTPGLEALAPHGVLFENARTASAWTKPSTASFMTGLHHSVLGGFTRNEDRIPDAAVTMAEHMHAAGYQTGVFTTNPFALTMSGLEQGVDLYRDRGPATVGRSSEELHADLLRWRDDWPGGPWWAHIQTTDVHEPHRPPEGWSGLYADEARRTTFEGWLSELNALKIERDTVLEKYRARLDEMGVDPRAFFRTQWDLYDETMTHNDATLVDLVDALKARGEWENTLLVVTADHGHPAGSFSRFGRGMLDPQPADWEGALADSHRTRVPLLFVWPGHLPAGRRISTPVSLIDLLPTVLELAGLPEPELQQGRSLVPLLTGDDTAPREVVLEQLQAWPATGEMVGHIEVIDGRWAASLEVMPEGLRDTIPEGESLKTAGGWRAARPHRPSTPTLLLYDLEVDPLCTHSVHAEYPERAAAYAAQLSSRWEAHQQIAATFAAADEGEMGEDQLEALRTLGYIE